MPIYEYKCKLCGEEFELLVPISERDSSKRCPKCGDTEVERLLSCIAPPRIEGSSSTTGTSSCSSCSGGTCSTCGHS